MRGPKRISRCLTALLLVLVVLILLPPWRAFSSGEVLLKDYVSKETVFVGEEVTFGTKPLPADLNVAEVRWDFGDGSEAVGWPVVHAYQDAGEYLVTAMLTFDTGTTAPAQSTRIRVLATGNKAPIAQADVSPRQTIAGQPISYDAGGSSDPDEGGMISRYRWDFGDGASASGVTATHSYGAPGTYYVILTVTDNGEMDATDIVTVSVSALPILILPGIDRVMPVPPAGGTPPTQLDPLVFVYMGVYDPDRLPYREWQVPLNPPFRGVATSNRDWLIIEPAEFERLSGTEVIQPIGFTVRNTTLLPRAHTSWALGSVVINGYMIELPVAVTVRGPAERDISADVWALYEEVLDYLTDKDQRDAMVYTPRYANPADLALGLITEYVIEDGYDGQLPRAEFVLKVAEILLDNDENGDGVVGFTDQDIGLGIKIGK